MTASPGPVLEVRGLVKRYQALRPLRLRALALAAGDRVALSGFDAAAAEMLVNMLNGASLPDEGDVVVFGRRTSEITDSDEWLASLDRFGMLTRRAALLDGATIEQNLALPFSLEIDPVPDDVKVKVVALAAETGLTREWLTRRAGEAPADVQMRAHLARALALDPALLLCEHPTAGLPPDAVAPFATTVRDVALSRRLTVLALTEDTVFAGVVCQRTYSLKPATGDLVNARGWMAALGLR